MSAAMVLSSAFPISLADAQGFLRFLWSYRRVPMCVIRPNPLSGLRWPYRDGDGIAARVLTISPTVAPRVNPEGCTLLRSRCRRGKFRQEARAATCGDNALQTVVTSRTIPDELVAEIGGG
jgi:hypothetical protein